MNLIIFATSNFKPHTGGIAELGHQLASALTATGHGVTVLASGGGPDSFDATAPYRVIRLSRSRLEQEARALAETENPEALFVLVLGSGLQTARRIGKERGIPVILYVHGLEVTKKNNIYPVFWAKQFVKGLILKTCDLVVCNSFNTMLLAIKRGAVPERVRVLNPGINPEEFSPVLSSPGDPAPGKTVFFTMGRLIRRKGADKVIEALPLLVKDFPDLLYVVAGDGPEAYRKELEERAASLGVSSHVRFLGRIGEDEKRLWYQRQDVFIMPSRKLENGDVEGFGIVFLEAGLWGKPVIGGRSGGVPDAVEDGKSGLLVDPESAEAVARGMRLFLEKPEERRRMGDYGRSRAREHFDWKNQARKLVNMIKPEPSEAVKKDFNQWKDLPTNEVFDKTIARENLMILKEVFDAAGLPFMIFFGTLLGALREHDFISHDTDTDVIVFESHRSLFNQILPQLEERGLLLVRSVKENRVLSLYRNGEYIDLYFMILKRIGLRWKWYIDLSSVSKKYLLEYDYYPFQGEMFRVPRQSEEVLRELYGKNWKVPIKDYEANHDSFMKLVRFLRKPNKMRALKNFFRWRTER